MLPIELGCGQDLWQLWLSLHQQGLHQSSEKPCHQGVGSCGSCPLHRVWCHSLTLSTVTCTSLTTSAPAATKNTDGKHVGAPLHLFSQLQAQHDPASAVPGAGRALGQCGVTADASPDRFIQHRQRGHPGGPQSSHSQSPMGHSQQHMRPLDVGMWAGATRVPLGASPRDQP